MAKHKASNKMDGYELDLIPEEFDYVLSPSRLVFIGPSILPMFLFFAPYIILKIMPEFYKIIGFIPSSSLTLVIAFVLSVVNFMVQVLKRRSTRLYLNIDYLVYKTGIFFTSIDRVYFVDIKNIKITKALKDKMLGIGTVAIATAGTSGYEVVISGFVAPERIVKYINVHRKEGE